jgi:outer membrane protein assembly factor BamB
MSGKVYALEKYSGKTLWTFVAEGRITAGASFMLVNGKLAVLVGTYSGFIYAIDADTGAYVWRTSAESFINGSAAVSGQRAAFGSCDGKLRLVDQSGALIWELKAGSYIPETTAISGTAVYAASYEGILYKLDLATGKIIWKVAALDEASFFTSPAVSSRYAVCAAKDDNLYVYRIEGGNPVIQYELSGTLSGSPLIAGQSIVWMTANGALSVADPGRQGEKPVTTPTGSRPAGGFLISQKKIYFCTTNGEIHCWRMK